MVEFSRYYIDFLQALFSNIKKFFVNFFHLFVDIFYTDPKAYIQMLVKASVQNSEWKATDWLVFVIVTIINLALLVAVIVLIVQLFRRYFRFRRKEVEKDELIEEVSILNQKVVQLIDEKNKILAMRVSQLGVGTTGSLEEEENKSKSALTESRFTKLTMVDREYEINPHVTIMNNHDMLELKEVVQRFINFAASQLHLYYTPEIVSRFIAGMGTGKLLILEGISGTGKTSLPYAMGKFFQHDTSIISVQPSWRDRAELLGYLNEFTKKFNETDFLKSVYAAGYSDTINIIVLDEMNLARVEYYFAEFLSIMEMPDINEWKIDLVSSTDPTDPHNLINGKLMIPQNVWFVGTANKDDSTFTITDKVYDRAVTLAINQKAQYIDAPYTENVAMTYEYLNELFTKAKKGFQLSAKAQQALNQLDDFIQAKFKIAFGNRIMKQIKAFVPVYMACGFTEYDGLDYMLTYKILRKFESLNLTFLHPELDQLSAMLDKLFGKGVFKVSLGFIEDLKKLG